MGSRTNVSAVRSMQMDRGTRIRTFRKMKHARDVMEGTKKTGNKNCAAFFDPMQSRDLSPPNDTNGERYAQVSAESITRAMSVRSIPLRVNYRVPLATGPCYFGVRACFLCCVPGAGSTDQFQVKVEEAYLAGSSQDRMARGERASPTSKPGVD